MDGPILSCNTATHVKRFKNFKYDVKYWKYSFLPQLGALNDKRQMHLNLNTFIEEYGVNEFPYLPTTFVLPEQLKEFRRAFKEEPNKLWITKRVRLVHIF